MQKNLSCGFMPLNISKKKYCQHQSYNRLEQNKSGNTWEHLLALLECLQTKSQSPAFLTFQYHDCQKMIISNSQFIKMIVSLR